MFTKSTSPESPAHRVPVAPVGCSRALELGTLGRLPEKLLREGMLPHLGREADFFSFAHASRDARRLCVQYCGRVMRQDIDARFAGIGEPGPVVPPIGGEDAVNSNTALMWLQRMQPRDHIGVARNYLAKKDDVVAAQKALTELEQLPVPEATWPEALGLQAKGLDALGRHDEAAALLAQAQEQDPAFWAERLRPFRSAAVQLPVLDVDRVLSQPRPPVESLVTIAVKDAAACNWDRARHVIHRALDYGVQPLGANVVSARIAFADGLTEEGFLFARQEIALLAGRLVPEETLTPLLGELSVGLKPGNRAFEHELLRTLGAAQAVPAMRYDAAHMQAAVLLRGGHTRQAAQVCLTFGLEIERYGLVYPAAVDVIM